MEIYEKEEGRKGVLVNICEVNNDSHLGLYTQE